MSVAKVIEISSSSTQSFEDAIQEGLRRAESSLKQVKGAWISEQKVDYADGRITAFRVIMKVTFVLD